MALIKLNEMRSLLKMGGLFNNGVSEAIDKWEKKC
jgi:hypothetical protein